MAENSRNNQNSKIKEITDKLEKGIAELFDSDRYKTFLSTMAKFHRYSVNNTLLIAMQKPDATLVAGYTDWQKRFGRQVLKGQKGIQILAPAPYKRKIETGLIGQDGKPVLGKDGKPVKTEKEVVVPMFHLVNVFDVSQTDGKELPSIGTTELSGEVHGYDRFFEALKRSCPVPIGFEKIYGGAKGYFHQEEKRIAIREGMSEVQNIKTLIHEMAHQKLHSIDDTIDTGEAMKKTASSKEVEAESVAYTVCQHYGIDTSDYSFAYVAGWSKDKEMPELKESLHTIQKASSELISLIDMKLAEINKEMANDRPAIGTEVLSCYVRITGKNCLEGREVFRVIGDREKLEAALQDIAATARRGIILDTESYLSREGIPALRQKADIESDLDSLKPEYSVDMDTGEVKRMNEPEESREEKANVLAFDLDRLAESFDPYDYRDRVDDPEQNVSETAEALLACSVLKLSGIRDYLKEIRKNAPELKDRCDVLESRLKEFLPAAEKTADHAIEVPSCRRSVMKDLIRRQAEVAGRSMQAAVLTDKERTI